MNLTRLSLSGVKFLSSNKIRLLFKLLARQMEQITKRHCTCSLGELFQEQVGLVLEQNRQKHSHLLVNDCYR